MNFGAGAQVPAFSAVYIHSNVSTGGGGSIQVEFATGGFTTEPPVDLDSIPIHQTMRSDGLFGNFRSRIVRTPRHCLAIR